MLCNIPRQVTRLSPSDRRVIEKYYADQAYKLADQENEKVQEYLIKMHCIWMKDHGATDEEIYEYIVWMKRTYRRVARCKTEAEQTAWMDAELARCFPGGFPQFRIDDMKSKERSILDG